MTQCQVPRGKEGEGGGENEKWDRSLVRATSEVTALLMSLLQANPSNPLLREDASLPSQVAVHHVQKKKQKTTTGASLSVACGCRLLRHL